MLKYFEKCSEILRNILRNIEKYFNTETILNVKKAQNLKNLPLKDKDLTSTLTPGLAA